MINDLNFRFVVDALAQQINSVKYTAYQQGKTGRFDANGVLEASPKADLEDPFLWVRIGASTQETRVVNAFGVQDLVSDIDVELGFNAATQEWHIIGLGEDAIRRLGNRFYWGLNAEVPSGSRQTSFDFEAGKLVSSEEDTLKVHVLPFTYVNSEGSTVRWDTALPVDLSDEQTAMSANQHRLIRISLDPDATSPALTATSGTAKTQPAIFTTADAYGIALPDGHIPLWVMRITKEDTTLTGGVGDASSFFLDDRRFIDTAANKLASASFMSAAGITELTISTGAITITEVFHSVDTESDASTDDLDTINGGINGRMIVLRAENAARTVVVKHGTGNILTPDAQDVKLTDINAALWLIYDTTDSNWRLLGARGSTANRRIISEITNADSPFSVSGDSNQLIRVNAVSGAVTANLPAISADIDGHLITLKKMDGSVNNMTIAANGSDVIDGAGSVVTAIQYDSFTLVADNSNGEWIIE